MSKTFLGVSMVVVVAIAIGGFFFPKNETVVEQIFGAAAGPEHTERQFFYDGIVDGGKYTSVSTTSATYTLSASQFKSGVVDVEAVALAAALTLTLPASTTDAYPTTPGMHTELIIKNSHTGAATTTTIAAGAGVDLQEPDGQNVVIGITNYALVDCVRLDTRDVACVIDETIPAD